MFSSGIYSTLYFLAALICSPGGLVPPLKSSQAIIQWLNQDKTLQIP